MSAAGAYLKLESAGVFVHWCPGCKAPHRFNISSIDRPDGLKWYFNGNWIRPTFTPAMRIEVDGVRCSYVLENGWLRFDADCTHPLAGQAVMIPSYPAVAVPPGGGVLAP